MKTTVVEGLLTSYELVLAILFVRWRARSCIAISCGSDAVTCQVTGRIITPLPHNIAQMLTSAYLNHNLSISRRRCRFRFCHYHLFFAPYFHPWKCGLLSSITLVFVVSILGTKDTTFLQNF